MITDPIADFLTQLRNAQLARHESTVVPASSKKARILDVLIAEGYVASYEGFEEAGNKKYFRVNLRYASNGDPVIRELKRLSKPGRRQYVSKEELPVFRGGLGTVVVSTSKGVVTSTEAKKLGIGGELLCSVF